MSTLLGPNGQPISSKDFQNKKVAPPARGEQYGTWGGPNVQIFSLPGGGAIQFDLDLLTLGDYRQMKDHYQINSSLSVLTFLLHQLEVRVVCENKQHEEFYNEQLENIWTPLVRSKAQAFWAGYSPNILQWDNDTTGRRVILTKIKDLVPELAEVNWKTVNGNGTEKISVYDGIKRWNGKSIPVANSYWYPLLMDNGNYYGKKLLRSAFQPWFFSLLVHLFANRYYERFGEPTPVGRAPFDDEVRINGETMSGNKAMEYILNQIRSRAAVVLPSDRTPQSDETNVPFDYQIEYLESQMRGADFERYMTRLDEEMSLALFTPILLMRTADVGSYNLGTQHSIIYQWMLNAIGGDWKYYIDWYLLRPMRDYNFGTNAPLPKFTFRRMGAQNQELISNIVSAMIAKGGIKPDIEELGQMAGLSLSEVRELTGNNEPPPDGGDGSDGDDDPRPSDRARRDHAVVRSPESGSPVADVAAKLKERIFAQVRNIYKNDLSKEDYDFSLGFSRQMQEAFAAEGVDDPKSATEWLYDSLVEHLGLIGRSGYPTADEFNTCVDNTIDVLIDEAR